MGGREKEQGGPMTNAQTELHGYDVEAQARCLMVEHWRNIAEGRLKSINKLKEQIVRLNATPEYSPDSLFLYDSLEEATARHNRSKNDQKKKKRVRVGARV
jgi:hypothetical protein